MPGTLAPLPRRSTIYLTTLSHTPRGRDGYTLPSMARYIMAFTVQKNTADTAPCCTTLHHTMTTYIAAFEGTVSEPLLNAKHALCTTKENIRFFTRWLAAIGVIVSHSLLTYLGGNVSGLMFLLLVAYVQITLLVFSFIYTYSRDNIYVCACVCVRACVRVRVRVRVCALNHSCSTLVGGEGVRWVGLRDLP